MAIEDWSVSGTNLTRVVEDDNLGIEGCSLLGRIILGVGSHITTADILDRHVPKRKEKIRVLYLVGDGLDPLHVETDVVTRKTLLKLLVVHFDRLDFSGDVRGSKCDNHSSLDDTSLDTTDRDSTDTTDFVDILEWQAEWLVGGTSWRFDGVDGIKESLAFNGTALDLLGPALVPLHAIIFGKSSSTDQPIRGGYELAGFLQHIVTMPAGDGYKRDGLGVVADLFNESRSLLHNFVEAILTPLR